MVLIFAGEMDFHHALVNIFCRYSINNLNSTQLKQEKFFFFNPDHTGRTLYKCASKEMYRRLNIAYMLL